MWFANSAVSVTHPNDREFFTTSERLRRHSNVWITSWANSLRFRKYHSDGVVRVCVHRGSTVTPTRDFIALSPPQRSSSLSCSFCDPHWFDSKCPLVRPSFQLSLYLSKARWRLVSRSITLLISTSFPLFWCESQTPLYDPSVCSLNTSSHSLVFNVTNSVNVLDDEVHKAVKTDRGYKQGWRWACKWDGYDCCLAPTPEVGICLCSKDSSPNQRKDPSSLSHICFHNKLIKDTAVVLINHHWLEVKEHWRLLSFLSLNYNWIILLNVMVDQTLSVL